MDMFLGMERTQLQVLGESQPTGPRAQPWEAGGAGANGQPGWVGGSSAESQGPRQKGRGWCGNPFNRSGAAQEASAWDSPKSVSASRWKLRAKRWPQESADKGC